MSDASHDPADIPAFLDAWERSGFPNRIDYVRLPGEHYRVLLANELRKLVGDRDRLAARVAELEGERGRPKQPELVTELTHELFRDLFLMPNLTGTVRAEVTLTDDADGQVVRFAGQFCGRAMRKVETAPSFELVDITVALPWSNEPVADNAAAPDRPEGSER